MAITIGQAILNALAGGKVMLTRELASRLGSPAENIRSAAHALIERGYIMRGEGCYQITDKGQDFVADGKTCVAGSQKGDFAARSRYSLRTRAWNLIRMRTTWSIDDLLMTLADGTERDAENSLKRYVKVLCKAGYVERAPRNPHLYRLINNTGRLAPSYNSPARTVTDPNTGEVHHV